MSSHLQAEQLAATDPERQRDGEQIPEPVLPGHGEETMGLLRG